VVAASVVFLNKVQEQNSSRFFVVGTNDYFCWGGTSFDQLLATMLSFTSARGIKTPCSTTKLASVRSVSVVSIQSAKFASSRSKPKKGIIWS
jgi:hypothetical protein